MSKHTGYAAGVSADAGLADLIGHFYQAAVDERHWSGMAVRIAAAFGSSSTVLKLHGTDTGVQLLECTDNLTVPAHLRDWAEHWHKHDLWVARSMAFGLSRIVTDHDLVTAGEQRASGYYQEWLGPLDIHHMIGAVFPTGGDSIGVLGVHRTRGAGCYDDACRARMAFVLPHLQRALQLGRNLAKASLVQAAALAALDKVDTGVLVVDKAGGIIHANALAENILEVSRELGVLHGRLYIKRPALHERLLAMVHANVDITMDRFSVSLSALAIPRAGQLPITLTAAPFSTGATRFADLGPLALIFLRDPEQSTLSARRLCDLFGLTRTEAAIAVDLGDGLPVQDIARRHSVGLATVRSHLKCILSKTGTHRQGAAIALIARSVAALPDRGR